MHAVTETTPAGFDLSPVEAAAQVGIHAATLKRWAIDGKVPAFRTLGGWWRFRQTDIDALRRQLTDNRAAS